MGAAAGAAADEGDDEADEGDEGDENAKGTNHGSKGQARVGAENRNANERPF